MTLVVIFFVPSLYGVMFIELVKDNKDFTPQRRLNRIYAIDTVMSIFLFTLSIIILKYGINTSMIIYTIIGFFIFIFFVGSLIFIQTGRLTNPESFLKKLKINLNEPDAKFEYAENDIYGLLMDNFRQLYRVPKPDNPQDTELTILPLTLFLLIFLGFYLLLMMVGLTDSVASIGVVSPTLLSFFITWYFVVVIAHVMRKRIFPTVKAALSSVS